MIQIICADNYNMQNFSKLYRKIKTQSSQRSCLLPRKNKIKIQIIQKSSDLNLSNVSINGNKLCFNNTPKQCNKLNSLQNQALKSFTSFSTDKKQICKLKKTDQQRQESDFHNFSISHLNNFLGSTFQIKRLQQILRSSQSFKKDKLNKSKLSQKQLQAHRQIKSFCKYKNYIIKNKRQRTSNLLQDNILQNIDIRVQLDSQSNYSIKKLSIKTNYQDEQQRKLQEIKKIVKRIQEKNKESPSQMQFTFLRMTQQKFCTDKSSFIKNRRSTQFQSRKIKHQSKKSKQLDIDNLQPWEFD